MRGSTCLELAEGRSTDVLAGSLGTLAEHGGGLVATDTSTPLAALVLVLVREVGLGSRDESGKLALVLGLDVLESEDSSGLLVDDGAETRLALDDHVGHTHLAAESGQEDHELDGVDIVSDHDERRLLGLDEGDGVVEAVLDEQGLLGVFGILVLSRSGSGGFQTGLFLLLRLGAVLVQELEKLGRSVLVQGVGELGDRGGNLEALVKNHLLALQADVLGPLDEAGEVSGGTDVLADTKVFGGRLEERVLLRLGALAGAEGGGGGLLAGSSLGLGGLVIETRVSNGTKKLTLRLGALASCKHDPA